VGFFGFSGEVSVAKVRWFVTLTAAGRRARESTDDDDGNGTDLRERFSLLTERRSRERDIRKKDRKDRKEGQEGRSKKEKERHLDILHLC
jgi:hypothetical protein